MPAPPFTLPDHPLSRSVCVFCASSDRVEARYKTLAADMGAMAAAEGWHVVYGGAQGGLMGAAADAAVDAGGKVTGVMPKSLVSMERAHQGLTMLYHTKDMHERQQMMAALSQGFVILPGGLGTLAEFFEILTWKQIGLHDKPIALVNAYGYWDPLLELMRHAQEQNFLHQRTQDLYHVFENIEELRTFFAFE